MQTRQHACWCHGRGRLHCVNPCHVTHLHTCIPRPHPCVGRGRAFLRAYSAAAGALALLVSAECYFTARYFHPPGEIVLAAVLGLAAFQAPLLWYAARAFVEQHAAHGSSGSAAVAVAAADGGSREHYS